MNRPYRKWRDVFITSVFLGGTRSSGPMNTH